MEEIQNQAPVNEPVQSPQATAPERKETPARPETKTFNYESSGNKSLDAALKILGRAGVAPDAFEMQQARNGDFGPLRAVLNYMGVEDADIALSLMEGAYNDFEAQGKAAKEATMKAAIETAGSPEAWDEVLQFIDSNADEQEAAELSAALEAGGAQANLAIKYMNLLYQAFGQSAEEGSEETEESPRSVASSSSPRKGEDITAQEFAVQYQRLLAQGYRETDPRVVRLQKQRLASIERGR